MIRIIVILLLLFFGCDLSDGGRDPEIIVFSIDKYGYEYDYQYWELSFEVGEFMSVYIEIYDPDEDAKSIILEQVYLPTGRRIPKVISISQDYEYEAYITYLEVVGPAGENILVAKIRDEEGNTSSARSIEIPVIEGCL